MNIFNFVWKQKQAITVLALGVLLVGLAVITEPGIVVYELPRDQAAWEASQLAKNFQRAVVIIGAVVAIVGFVKLFTKCSR